MNNKVPLATARENGMVTQSLPREVCDNDWDFERTLTIYERFKGQKQLFQSNIMGFSCKETIVRNQKISIARRIEKIVNSYQFFVW